MAKVVYNYSECVIRFKGIGFQFGITQDSR